MARRKSDAQRAQEKSLRESLRFAKERGFTGVDLRKPLNPYRRRVAREFLEASKSPQQYQAVRVPRGRTYAGPEIETQRAGRVLVKKPVYTDTVRTTKDGRLSITSKTGAKKRLSGYRLPRKKRDEVYVIQVGSGEMEFDDAEDLIDYMEPYDPNSERYRGGNYAHWQRYVAVRKRSDLDDDESREIQPKRTAKPRSKVNKKGRNI